MRFSVSRSQAQDFRKRWKMVNDAERQELRSTPISVKARQLEVMMAAARELNWLPQLAIEENDSRHIWQQLRKLYQPKLHENTENR